MWWYYPGARTVQNTAVRIDGYPWITNTTCWVEALQMSEGEYVILHSSLSKGTSSYKSAQNLGLIEKSPFMIKFKKAGKKWR
jgi:hypothetical protein